MATQTAVPQTSSSAASLRGCTGLKLKQITRHVGRFYDAHFADAGLKSTQYSLLSHVLHLGPLRPSDLAAALSLDASTLTRNLQPLVAQGWIDVGAGADGRSRLVQITEAGRAKRTQAQRGWKQAQQALHAKLGAERVAQLHGLIDECMLLLGASEEDARID